MIKKKVIVVLAGLLVIGVVVFLFRYRILQYSTETIIRNSLPSYVRVDKILLNPPEGKILLNNFKILDPPDFSYKYLIEIAEITAKYKMRGKTILSGVEILDPVLKKVTMNVERLGDGRLNIVDMRTVLENEAAAKEKGAVKPKKEDGAGGRKISDLIKLPEIFLLKEGQIIFVDRTMPRKPHVITFEGVEAKMSLKLDDLYSKVLSFSSEGEGRVNGKKNEIVKWTISLNPTTPQLTMSNRFEVSGLDILPFEPYYDKYSPFVFKSGRFSGTLVFDFDNGSIGSTNEIHLSGLEFSIKQGYENALFWEASVQDLAKYFTSPFGDIVFDFKIKGDMSNPKFFLGPISKQAVASMTIDKISAAIGKATGSQQSSGSGAAKNDVERAKEYIDLIKGLINKK